MQKLSEKGIAQIIILLILLAGIAGVVYLVTSGPLKIFPKASVSGPIGPTTSFTFSPNKNSLNVGEIVGVKIVVRADVAAANLFTAKINFNKDLLAVDSIDYTNTLVKNWVEQFSDNATGNISLIGGVPSPGFQTASGGAAAPMAVIYFKALKGGSATISFADASAIYSNADNLNILIGKEPLTFSITSGGTPQPSSSTAPNATVVVSPVTVNRAGTITVTWSGIPNPDLKDILQFVTNGMTQIVGNAVWINNCQIAGIAPSSGTPKSSGSCTIDLSKANIPSTVATLNVVLYSGKTIGQIVALSNQFTLVSATPVPSATPIPGSGDGNRDGKVDLIDLSVLLTDFNKTSGFRTPIDMNGDGKINVFDFSLMRNLLIQKGVIKG